MNLVLIAMGLGALAVIYGYITSRQVLGASAGSPRMQEIAAAIQEGAQAYLKRQYTTIAIVGVVAAIIIAASLGHDCRDGLCAGRGSVGRGRFYRHECVGAIQRADGGGGNKGFRRG
jgi:K(+)-stimulated pyrophosphate-energized sodium pump